MAEETTAVQNKGMLVVAIVLGLAAVIVYNWQVATIRSESRGEQVMVLQFERDMRADEKIDTDKDLSTRQCSKKLTEGLGDVVVIQRPDEMKLYRWEKLNRNVQKGQLLLSSMFIRSKEPPPSERMSDGDFVAKAVPVRLALGDILRAGDRVNLLARIPASGSKIRVERIIERVRVLAVGGKGARDTVGGGRGEDEGSTTYRQITIELSSDASLELEKILAYLSGGLDVELLKPTAESADKKDKTILSPQVKPGILPLLEAGGAPPPRGGGGGGPLPSGG